ncbi:uncharacterized protein LOC135194125 [Vanessa tameamea]|uniref:protein-disulfide reductase n=1 Tax=Vanessa tameamea TaxID=334116 RepID=A0ABM4AUK4_VANTA
MEATDLQLKPYKWLNEAAIFNKNDEQIPIEWLETNADFIVLLFTSCGVDKDGIIEKFYEIYENVKFVNLPIEVIFVPMDETEEDFNHAYEQQANWFTLKYSDPLVVVLKYMYGITCVPSLVVIKVDGTIISKQGILDLEKYGKNAVVTWISRTASIKNPRKLSKELTMYGDKWKYMTVVKSKPAKADYQRKFSTAVNDAISKSSE